MAHKCKTSRRTRCSKKSRRGSRRMRGGFLFFGSDASSTSNGNTSSGNTSSWSSWFPWGKQSAAVPVQPTQTQTQEVANQPVQAEAPQVGGGRRRRSRRRA